MNEIHYSHDSSNDLVEIEKYICDELANQSAAKKTVKKITEKIRLLEKFAELGSPLASIIDLETDYRFLVCDNYLVFYRIDGKNIFILRVIYGGREYLAILFKDQGNHGS